VVTFATAGTKEVDSKENKGRGWKRLRFKEKGFLGKKKQKQKIFFILNQLLFT
jgi:hypothetical protein